jgi:hypothetical protein
MTTTIEALSGVYRPPVPEQAATDLSLGELVEAYRVMLAERDALNAVEKQVNQAIDTLQTVLRAKIDEAGLDKVSGNGISVWLDEQAIVKIDPDKWEDIVDSLAESGKSYLIQKRITASKLQDLIDAGEVLPEGLTLDSLPTLKHRRA